MDLKKTNYPLALIILISGIAYVVYLMLPVVLTRFNGQTSTGVITTLNDHQLEYSYQNKFDGDTYSVSRYLSVPDYEKLHKQPQITVLYPEFFPEEALVLEIDKQKPLLIMAFMLIFLLGALWRVGSLIRGNAS
ncbi:hypothetical protein ACFST9_23915 [Hymenobacter monticola]|uniref:DUF3592 domain-containing protein n=1 Tax=Hymenobacter monticola TaxID=1705399 RepID=A0ABY4B4X6_9BACT|nr:hypothetical protein [Hymenobacter monticola]UOE33854.1 hypothetical protein MTP16_22410 [Hymenobacter monticola]